MSQLNEEYADSVYSCLIDNGEGVNHVNSSVVEELKGIEKYSSPIHIISGIEHTAIKIYHFIKLSLRFSSGFITSVAEFHVVSSEFLED